MSVLALLPARGGSKEIPRKNIKELAGKLLIEWTINAALKAECIDKIVVSTEDEEIAEVARRLGVDVPFLRPAELATDIAPSIAPALHAIKELPDFEWIMLLQPTSPLRSAADIDGIFKFCLEKNASSAVSICEVNQNPYWMYRKDDSSHLQPLLSEGIEITRRQDLPVFYALNGALYLARTDWLLQHQTFINSDTLGYVMPIERSVDIDTLGDWAWVEYLIEQQNAK